MVLRKDRFVVNEIKTVVYARYLRVGSVILIRSVFGERSGTNTHGKHIRFKETFKSAFI